MPTPEDERREHSRVKMKVSVELREEGSKFPMGGGTADLSLTGCYIENIFPFAIGTTLELKLRVSDGTVLVLAKVVTADPQVGNGMEFINMLPEDVEKLRAFLEEQQKTPTNDEARTIYLKSLVQKTSTQP
jgi:hypothetical protein